MEENNGIKITRLCELEDVEMEREFFFEDTKKSLPQTRRILLMLGFVYFLFIIPDHFLIGAPRSLLIISLNRILFLALVLFLYWGIGKIRNYARVPYAITAYEVVCSLFFMHVYYYHSNPSILIQGFGVMVILLGMCLLPNKWVMNLAASVFIGLSFLVFTLFFIRNIDYNNYSAAVVYVVLIIVLSNLFLFEINRNKRVLYVKNRKLEELAFRDAMTGLYSKNKFDTELKVWISFSKRYAAPLTVAVFDLDDFKAVNDRYGHLCGDRYIVDTSMVMKASVRSCDILARWGGDEFALLMPHTSLEGARVLVERIRRNLGANLIGGIRTTCSCGVAQAKPDDDEVTLITRADKLLYKAKDEGKDRVAY